jgi:hypothetical protein
MGAFDPAPVRKTRPPPAPERSPGWAFVRLAALVAGAIVLGWLAYRGLGTLFGFWHRVRATPAHGAERVLALIAAFLVAGWFLWRNVGREPSHGLSDRVRNGGGHTGLARADGFGQGTGYALEAEVVADVVELVIDVIVDV